MSDPTEDEPVGEETEFAENMKAVRRVLLFLRGYTKTWVATVATGAVTASGLGGMEWAGRESRAEIAMVVAATQEAAQAHLDAKIAAEADAERAHDEKERAVSLYLEEQERNRELTERLMRAVRAAQDGGCPGHGGE